ncbi:MAG: hypothetical protein AAF202_05805 [Pseudomonadota bacterium]
MTQRIWLQAYLYFAFRANDFRDRVIESLEKLKVALAKETRQTKDMLQIYRLQTQGLASDSEIREANKQFRDLLKGMGLGVLIVLPFSPITLPLVVKLGRKLGVEVLPDSFKDAGL